ncbi:MAG: hypothetical protein KF773_08510 [Deltaproteobacteria bacterium]|nr:hypothetical protein [Deltaproteobacteria bacterium]
MEPAPKDDRPLARPAHLASEGAWLAHRKVGAVAAVLGALAFLLAAVTSGQLGTTPDWRLTVPLFVATAVAAGISAVRREVGAYPLWLVGLGLAGAATVLGWFLMMAIVVGATVVLILILHALF